MKKTILSLIILALILTFAPAQSQGQSPNPPGQFSYQGFLTDANGLPLATNNPINYTVTFRIYNQAANGVLLWAEQQVVTVDRGYFTVMLGNGTSVGPNSDLTSVFTGTNTVPSDASDRYLELTVTDLGSTPISPRLRLLPSPYAYLATTALNVSAAGHVPDTTLSANVALRAGGNTFSGNQVITGGSISMDNNATIRAKDTIFNQYDDFLIPRRSDDSTLLSYGSGGFSIVPSPLQTSIIIPPPPPAVNEIGGLFMAAGPSGWVGIGTSSPGAMLDVNGGGIFRGPVGIAANVANNTLQFGMGKPGQQVDAGKIGYEVFTSDSLDIVGAGTTGTNRKIKFWAEGGANFDGNVNIGGYGNGGFNTTLTVNGTAAVLGSVGIGVTGPNNPLDVYGNADFIGSVGIGTTTPQFPLDIVGYALVSSNGYGYLNAAGSTGHYNNPPGDYWPYSIRAGYRIMAQEFNAVSDSRIKDIIGQSDRQADLEVIQKLRVTDYRMKDRVANGDILCKGFIAQEVETVIPEAVTKSRQFVPDIYAAASGAKFDPAAKTVAVKLAKAHGLKTGDRVRLMTEAGHMDLTVSSVPSEQEFVAANCEKDPKQVFVFGKEVNDFRTLNYDRIFTTGISAMQELARRVSALEGHEAERVALEKRAARVDELEGELADLKVIVARLAQAQKNDAGVRPVRWQRSGFGLQQAASEQSEALLAAEPANGATQQRATAQPGE
jgi:hypothetical protein